MNQNMNNYKNFVTGKMNKFYKNVTCDECNTNGHVVKHCEALSQIGNGVRELCASKSRMGDAWKYKGVNAIHAYFHNLYGNNSSRLSDNDGNDNINDNSQSNNINSVQQEDDIQERQVHAIARSSSKYNDGAFSSISRRRRKGNKTKKSHSS